MRRLRRWLAVGAALLGSLALPGAMDGQLADAPAAASSPEAQPPAAAGGLVVPAGTTSGEVILLRGPLDVFGTVRGDVVTLAGPVTVHPGARVAGDVVSVWGTVRLLPGARVDGTARSYARVAPGARAESTAEAARGAPPSPWRGAKTAIGWAAILLVIGIGVLALGSSHLETVSDALAAGVGRALLVGALAQLLLLPALAATVVALAVSIVGLLAIPLAVAAAVLAVAGLATLGFLAVALLGGRSLAQRGDAPRAGLARGDAVRALAFGVGTFAVLWTVTALSAPSPALSLVLRAIATALTWVTVTAGFGAALLSRAGTRRPTRPAAGVRSSTGAVPAERSGVPVWQTPTPIAGIAAARRPTPVPGRLE